MPRRAPAGGLHGYEGGQFMPSRDESAFRAPSPRQIAADATRDARVAHDRAVSRHVGAVGATISATLTVARVMVFQGYYGPTYLTIARDDAGNVVVSRGVAWAREGETLSVTATIRAHENYDGTPQTVVKWVRRAR